jgi:nicotinamidase-related amidase
MDPKTTGLVLIEFQNDFTSAGGTLHDAVKGVMEGNDMLNKALAAADALRAAGGTVFHSPISFAPGYGDITAKPYGILAGVVESSSFIRGGWGAAIVDVLAPKDGDVIIEGKKGLDAFASSNLGFVLHSKGIKTVVLAGFLTNCCVESTMRSAYEQGFDVVTLTDAVAATSQEEHDNAIKYDYPMFSNPITVAEFIEALEGTAVVDGTRGY